MSFYKKIIFSFNENIDSIFRKNVCLDDKFIDKLFIFTKNPKNLKACNPVKIGIVFGLL